MSRNLVVLCKNLENLFVLNKEALFVFGGHLNYFLIKFAGICDALRLAVVCVHLYPCTLLNKDINVQVSDTTKA